MSRIRIKNFGPIKEGYLENDGWLDVKKVTVLIGNQGSGKSTVAKLISTLSWIEKSMVMGTIRRDELDTHNFFLKQLAYQRIEKYKKSDTVIEYEGKAFAFQFINDKFTVRQSTEDGYLLPKIMYAPAERNFLSTVDRPGTLKNLPATLYTFNDEFDTAKNYFASGVDLPINNVKFQYDQLNKLAWISGDDNDYKLRLSEASSGFQSTVPLFLVTKYLSDRLNVDIDISIRSNSLEDQKMLDKELDRIINDPELTPEIVKSLLRIISSKRKRACLINIVEEPEQNLFPASQRSILHSLLAFNNMREGNKLIMTTHSPYLINYISIAVKADELKRKIKTSEHKERLDEIVPVSSTVDPDDLSIYELKETDGSIRKLGGFEGIPSDKNFLNQSIRQGNIEFDNLLEIEQEL